MERRLLTLHHALVSRRHGRPWESRQTGSSGEDASCAASLCQGVFDGFAHPELDRPVRLEPDSLACLRIAAKTSFAVEYVQRSKGGEPYAFAADKSVTNSVNEGVQHLLHFFIAVDSNAACAVQLFESCFEYVVLVFHCFSPVHMLSRSSLCLGDAWQCQIRAASSASA